MPRERHPVPRKEEIHAFPGFPAPPAQERMRAAPGQQVDTSLRRLPAQVLRLIQLCEQGAAGNPEARRLAIELGDALNVLSKFDEGPDLVLYYKELMVLEGHREYELHLNESDALSSSQREFLHSQWRQFKRWWSEWPGANQD